MNPPAQHLRKFNFHGFTQVLPNTFTYYPFGVSYYFLNIRLCIFEEYLLLVMRTSPPNPPIKHPPGPLLSLARPEIQTRLFHTCTKKCNANKKRDQITKSTVRLFLCITPMVNHIYSNSNTRTRVVTLVLVYICIDKPLNGYCINFFTFIFNPFEWDLFGIEILSSKYTGWRS